MGFAQKIHYIKHGSDHASLGERVFGYGYNCFTLSELKKDSKDMISEILLTGEDIPYMFPIGSTKKGQDICSEITSSPKKSLWYHNCLALVGTGYNQDGIPLSLLGHIESGMLYPQQGLFSDASYRDAKLHLEMLLQSFYAQVEIYNDLCFSIHGGNNSRFHDKAVEVLQNLVETIFKREVRVGSLKNTTGPSHIVIDTPNEIIHVLRDDGMKKYDTMFSSEGGSVF